MKKKLLFGALVVVVSLALLGGVSFAAEPRHRLHGLGKVIAVDLKARALTIENRKGTFTLLTDDETRFRIRGVEDPSFGDIHIGDVVTGVVVRTGEEGTFLAKLVAVVPPRRQVTP